MAQTSKMIHNGTTIIPDNAHDSISDNVVGHGDWIVGAGATLSFEYGVSVGGGQEIELSNKHADGVSGRLPSRHRRLGRLPWQGRP